MPEFTTLSELLLWIAGGGGAAIIVGRAVALFLEDTSWWHRLSPTIKKWAVRFLAVAFGLLAEFLLTVDLASIFGQYAPLVGTLVLAFWNWLSSQEKYIQIKETSYADKARVNIMGP